MPASTYLRGELMKYAFTATAMGTRPTAWHVALFTADPGAAGSANEKSVANGYARIDATAVLTRTASVVSNSGGAVTFGTVTTAGYTITHAGVFDATTGGNALFFGALAVPKVLAVGDALVFATGELVLDLV